MRRHYDSKPQPNHDLIYGFHAVTEAITSGRTIDKLFIQEGLKGEHFSEIRRLTKEYGCFYQMVPLSKIERLAPGKNHQGVAAFLSPVTFSRIEEVLPTIFEKGETPLILILDQITDVRNFGAIARSASCAGVHAIVIPSRGAAAVNEDAVKTSAGALHSMIVCKEHNLKDTIEYLKTSGLRIAGCTEKGSDVYYKTDLTGPLAVIMGSEEDGISHEYLKRCDVKVQIPMQGTVGSLNVSVATGIVLFEINRQRHV